jgi:hypothetical protein
VLQNAKKEIFETVEQKQGGYAESYFFKPKNVGMLSH